MTVYHPSNTTFLNIPNLTQILILAYCRFTEPLAFSSLSPYLYFMIKDFGYDSPETIYPLVTAITVSMAIGQLASSVVWGCVSEKYGRKPALLLSLLFGVVNPIMFGFATNIHSAVAIRLLCGILNGKIIVIRTMASDLVATQKEFRSHVFTVLTAATYAGYIIGPAITGIIANPVKHFPDLFGDFWLFEKFPYLLPNLFSAPLVIGAILAVALFVEESGVSDHLLLPRDKDLMLRVGNLIRGRYVEYDSGEYTQLSGSVRYDTFTTPEDSSATVDTVPGKKVETLKSSISQALIKPVIVTVLCDTLLHFHCTFFLHLLTMFFATPRMDSSYHSPIRFNGGLGLDSSVIGVILATVNVFTLLTQLKLFPAASMLVGTANVHKIGLLGYLSYLVVPYITLLPPGDSYMVFGSILVITMSLGFAGSFAVPSLEVLLTHASPPHVLSIATGMSQAGQAFGRVMGPLALGGLNSLGASIDVIGLVWWILGAFVVVELFLSRQLSNW